MISRISNINFSFQSFTYVWNVCCPEYPSQHQHAPGNNDFVRYLFHDAGRITGDQGQEDGRAVQVPEQKQFSATGRGASDVTEQVTVGIPENTIEAQHHLVEVTKTQTFNGGYLPVRQRWRKLHSVRQRLCLRVGRLLQYAQR